MGPRGKSALLWGAIGGLCFPALTTGYRLAIEPIPLSIGETLLIAVGLGCVVAAIAYVVEPRLIQKGRT